MNLAKAFRDRHLGANVVRRTRNAIHVETAPGKFIAELHSGPIHRLDGGEIDTAWVPAVSPWQHQMTSADYHAFALANFGSGQILRYLHPASGESITFQPQALQWTNALDQIQAIANVASVIATVTDDVLRWNGAFGAGRDFIWQTSTDLLAKELILAVAPPAPPQFILDGGNPVLRLQFIIGLSSGATAWVDGVAWNRQTTVTTGNLVEFRDDAGNVLWRFNAATAIDANGDNAPGVLTRFRRAGNSLFVEVRVPHSWLATAAYPVVVDPTLTLQPDEAASKDQWIWAGQPDTNRGTDAFLDVGGVTTNARRALLQFDLTSIPASATVDSALMSLWLHTNLGATTNRTARVYRLRSGRDWVENQATWNSYKTSNAWTTAGGDNTTSDREATDIGSALLGASDTAGTQYDFTLTASAVGEWVSGAVVNNGMIVILDSPAAADIWRLASSNFATAGQRPKFVVEYSEGAAGVPKHFMHYARLRQ